MCYIWNQFFYIVWFQYGCCVNFKMYADVDLVEGSGKITYQLFGSLALWEPWPS